jgi:demethylmenaquinone methyltransferase/2-methoxy-6-polyprenyl-1,4-benzoquinol methylase
LHKERVPSRVGVPEMFDRISRRYDSLNHLLSLGLDIRWRKQAVKKLGPEPGQIVLDLACGTGDLAIAAAKSKQQGRFILGIDMAFQMLHVAQQKVIQRALDERIAFVMGDGMALPLVDNSVDAATIAFGIRNMPDTSVCLRELHRVVRPGGRVVVLEFSLPENRLVRSLYLPYFRHVLPLLGRTISGDSYAYRYLDRTVETYTYGEEFVALMETAGFCDVRQKPLTWGVVTLYTGEIQ